MLFFAGLTLFSTSTSAKAKKPEWVTNYGRSTSYPETQFLIGFGASSGIGTETKEIAQDNARADNVLPADIIRQRYLDEEIKKKQLEERLNELSLLDSNAPIDLDEFRELLQEELANEDSRKAALQGLIEEIVAHPDYTMEVKYRIGGNGPVEPTSYPHESRYAHGGTYITSDNFPAQKDRYQNSVVPQFLPLRI